MLLLVSQLAWCGWNREIIIHQPADINQHYYGSTYIHLYYHPHHNNFEIVVENCTGTVQPPPYDRYTFTVAFCKTLVSSSTRCLKVSLGSRAKVCARRRGEKSRATKGAYVGLQFAGRRFQVYGMPF